MRKIAAAGMAVFLVGMSAGSGYMWKEAPVYAAEAVFETDEGQKDGYQIDVLTDELQNSDVDIIMDETELPNEAELLDEAELPDNARKVVAKNTRKSMSKSQKLETCFRWVMKRYYRTWRRFSQGGKAWYAVNANDHFERGCGDCIADASAFAYLAKALGYKNVYVCTDGYRNDENSHGWAEINGRVYDPLFAEAKSYSRNYGVRYGVYPLSPVMRVKIA